MPGVLNEEKKKKNNLGFLSAAASSQAVRRQGRDRAILPGSPQPHGANQGAAAKVNQPTEEDQMAGRGRVKCRSLFVFFVVLVVC